MYMYNRGVHTLDIAGLCKKPAWATCMDTVKNCILEVNYCSMEGGKFAMFF